MADDKNYSGNYGQDSQGQEGATIPPAPEYAPTPVSATSAFPESSDSHADASAPAHAQTFPAAPSYDSFAAGHSSATDPTAPTAPAEPSMPGSSPFQPTAPTPEWQQQPGYQPTPPAAVPVMAPADPYQAAQAQAAQAAAQSPYGIPVMSEDPYDDSVAELSELTGGMKFGWLCIGLFMSVVGMLIAWLVNVDKHPQVKKDAILWSVIGFAIRFVFIIIASVAFAGILMAAITSSGYYGGGYYF